MCIRDSLLIYLPNSIKKAPVFLGYNFQGNHTVIDDKNIFITKSWVPANEALGVTSNQATEKSRGEMCIRDRFYASSNTNGRARTLPFMCNGSNSSTNNRFRRRCV